MESSHKLAESRGGIDFWGAVSIGVGGMVGGGIFAVLGLATELARGATPVAFLCSGVVALLTGYSYAKLSVAYPTQGGTVVFIDRAFGVDLVTGSINNLLWVSYIVTLSLYTVAFANYGETFFHSGFWVHHALITAGIVVPTVLNLTSPKLISRTETFVVGLKVVILAVVILFGIRGISTARIAPGQWESPLNIIGAGMLIFVAYEGFELIANTAPDVEDYKKTLPRAYYASITLVIVLYVLIAIVTAGTLSAEQVQKAQDFALAAAAKPSLGQAGFTMVAVAAVLATFSAINATLYGSARLAASIAAEDELPEFLEIRVWHQPIVGLIVTALAAVVLANTIDLASISTMGSAGFLLIFAAVNAASAKNASEVGSKAWISWSGTFLCLAALTSLLWHTYTQDPTQLWYFVGMLALATLMEWLYRDVWKRYASSARKD